jgi:hypothetical protein
MTVLLFPRTSELSETVDLRAHYYANSAIFLRANAAAWALALFCNWSLYAVDTWINPWLSIPAMVVVLSLLVARTKRPMLHGIFSVTVVLAMVLMLLLQGVRIT